MTNADCIVDSFDPEVSPKNKRQLTVSYVRRLPDRRLVPAMIMKGQWLAAAGFSTGTRVEVRVMDGCIVLRRLSRNRSWKPRCAGWRSCRPGSRSRSESLSG